MTDCTAAGACSEDSDCSSSRGSSGSLSHIPQCMLPAAGCPPGPYLVFVPCQNMQHSDLVPQATPAVGFSHRLSQASAVQRSDVSDAIKIGSSRPALSKPGSNQQAQQLQAKDQLVTRCCGEKKVLWKLQQVAEDMKNVLKEVEELVLSRDQAEHPHGQEAVVPQVAGVGACCPTAGPIAPAAVATVKAVQASTSSAAEYAAVTAVAETAEEPQASTASAPPPEGNDAAHSSIDRQLVTYARQRVEAAVAAAGAASRTAAPAAVQPQASALGAAGTLWAAAPEAAVPGGGVQQPTGTLTASPITETKQTGNSISQSIVRFHMQQQQQQASVRVRFAGQLAPLQLPLQAVRYTAPQQQCAPVTPTVTPSAPGPVMNGSLLRRFPAPPPKQDAAAQAGPAAAQHRAPRRRRTFSSLSQLKVAEAPAATAAAAVAAGLTKPRKPSRVLDFDSSSCLASLTCPAHMKDLQPGQLHQAVSNNSSMPLGRRSDCNGSTSSSSGSPTSWPQPGAGSSTAAAAPTPGLCSRSHSHSQACLTSMHSSVPTSRLDSQQQQQELLLQCTETAHSSPVLCHTQWQPLKSPSPVRQVPPPDAKPAPVLNGLLVSPRVVKARVRFTPANSPGAAVGQGAALPDTGRTGRSAAEAPRAPGVAGRSVSNGRLVPVPRPPDVQQHEGCGGGDIRAMARRQRRRSCSSLTDTGLRSESVGARQQLYGRAGGEGVMGRPSEGGEECWSNAAYAGVVYGSRGWSLDGGAFGSSRTRREVFPNSSSAADGGGAAAYAAAMVAVAGGVDASV